MKKSPFKSPLLSKRQTQLVETIERLTRERGYPPSLREVAAAMDVSFGRIGQLARTTEAKGAIAREPGIARSWRPTLACREARIRCDECKSRITDRGLAVVVAGPDGRPLVACKGRCHQATERKFPSTAGQGFYELTDFLEQVLSPPATR